MNEKRKKSWQKAEHKRTRETKDKQNENKARKRGRTRREVVQSRDLEKERRKGSRMAWQGGRGSENNWWEQRLVSFVGSKKMKNVVAVRSRLAFCSTLYFQRRKYGI